MPDRFLLHQVLETLDGLIKKKMAHGPSLEAIERKTQGSRKRHRINKYFIQ